MDHRHLSIIGLPLRQPLGQALRQPLRQPLLLHIQIVLEDHNSYVKELKHVYEVTNGSQQISNFKTVVREHARPPLEHA